MCIRDSQLSDRVKKLVKLLGLSREERDSQRQVKLANKKSKRDELKLKQREAAEEEAPAEEAKAETEAEPEAAEEKKPRKIRMIQLKKALHQTLPGSFINVLS